MLGAVGTLIRVSTGSKDIILKVFMLQGKDKAGTQPNMIGVVYKSDIKVQRNSQSFGGRFPKDVILS